MKNLIILTFIFSSIFLASCWKEENIENTINTNSGQNIQSEIKSETENKEITNTGTIQVEPLKVEKKSRILAIENFNIVLKEDWKTINKLTTKATGKKECNWDAGDEWKSFSTYKIIADNWIYWIIKKEETFCWAETSITYFWIDLVNNTELTEIEIRTFWAEAKLENNILKFIILSPEFIVENATDRWDIWVEDVKNEWFKKEWNDWVKIIDLKNIIKPEIKKETKVEIQKTEEAKLDSKYSDANLKKNWYKLNILWKIKEYYKEETTPESEEYGRWFTTRKTIYIEWSKVLDFEVNNLWWQNLIIKAPISTEISIQEYWDWYEFQKIFWWNIIITDINTIKIGDKIIWSR